jgi:hypothetical protein
MQYGMFHMHLCEQCRRQESRKHSPTHQTAHTDTCKAYHTAYKTVSLRMNTRSSKLVIDITD